MNFCKYKINEYCKDSKSYLEELVNWKNNLSDTTNKHETLYFVNADFKVCFLICVENL